MRMRTFAMRGRTRHAARASRARSGSFASLALAGKAATSARRRSPSSSNSASPSVPSHAGLIRLATTLSAAWISLHVWAAAKLHMRSARALTFRLHVMAVHPFCLLTHGLVSRRGRGAKAWRSARSHTRTR